MKRKILIVEDDDLNMRLMIDLLQAHGFETFENKDGCNLIELVRLNRPNLIIMDILLPGNSGLELVRNLKADEHLKSVPILVVTALALSGEEKLIKEGGCDEYIPKPISIPHFLKTVIKLMN